MNPILLLTSRPLSRSLACLACALLTALPLASHSRVQIPAAAKVGERGALVGCSAHASVARAWNEQALAAIRRDAPRPTVHARNLFHLSVAMYDAWAAYDPVATAHLHAESGTSGGDIDSARQAAVSHAAFRLLSHRFQASPGAAVSLAAFQNCMLDLGFDPTFDQTAGDSPAALGNRVAATLIAHGLGDGSNEQNSYLDDGSYFPINAPMLVALPGTGGVVDVNAWQPLIPPGAPGVQSFLTPHWRNVVTFAIARPGPGLMYLDPGPQPRLGGDGDAALRTSILGVIRASSRLDPDDGEVIDISPAQLGNNSLGVDDGLGYPFNPVTGEVYPPNPVLRGDWTRALAELWADGPQSSTPPGHWNEIANVVTDALAGQLRIGGTGAPVSALEWDVKLYLTLNGATHDAAVATWEVKRTYDASRPITLVREMGSLGQSSDPLAPAFHPDGLPLEGGLVEVITAESSAPGERHEHLAAHLGSIAIRAWRGHPANPASEHGGVGWILADTWLPYQQANFVTPPFAGYTSGHSAFSRASAEVLSAFTGSPYFPGGLGEARVAAEPGAFSLGFEFGPSQPVSLQWASYFDASDEAGQSRVHGGIHPDYDDYPGRVIGHHVGLTAIARAFTLFGSPAGMPEARTIPAVGPWGLAWVALFLVALATWKLRRSG